MYLLPYRAFPHAFVAYAEPGSCVWEGVSVWWWPELSSDEFINLHWWKKAGTIWSPYVSLDELQMSDLECETFQDPKNYTCFSIPCPHQAFVHVILEISRFFHVYLQIVCVVITVTLQMNESNCFHTESAKCKGLFTHQSTLVGVGHPKWLCRNPGIAESLIFFSGSQWIWGYAASLFPSNLGHGTDWPAGFSQSFFFFLPCFSRHISN